MVVIAACAATFQQTIDTTVSHHFDSGGLAGVGVPDLYRYRSCDTSFNPRVHCCTFHSIGSAIKFPLSSRTGLSASRSRNSQMLVLPCGNHAQSFRTGVSGMPNLRWFRSNQRVSIPITCFHVISVHMEREVCVPDPSRAKSSDNRVPSNSCRRHLLWL